jgi:hypothetical protein
MQVAAPATSSTSVSVPFRRGKVGLGEFGGSFEPRQKPFGFRRLHR